MREALPDRYAVLVDECAGLGLRQGEAFGLAVDDIDFFRGVVHVRRQVKIIGSRLVFAPPKGGRVRDVPLPESVPLRLAAYLQAFRAREVTLPAHPARKQATVRLVLTTRESAAANRKYVNAFLWKPALRVAGVAATRENGIHALRHHFASVLLEGGVSIKAVSEYLGHADAGFTLRTYTPLMPSSEDRMPMAIDAALGPATSVTVVTSEGR